MTIFIFCLLFAVGSAFLAHRHDIKALKGRKVPRIADDLPMLLGATFYTFFVLFTGRPVLSMLLVAGGSLAIWGLNRVKFSLYSAPILFFDVYLLPAILRHPEFYTPYILPRKAIISLIVGCCVLAALLAWEPALEWELRLFAAAMFSFCVVAQWRLWRLYAKKRRNAAKRVLHRHELSLEPRQDWENYGLITSCYLHGLWHRHIRSREGAPGIPFIHGKPPENQVWPPAVLRPLEHKPHLVLIQAESFFDLRRMSPEIDPELLTHYDSACLQGLSGQLRVPAQGAYTMRTEFSVLTGLPVRHLGTDAFDPYFTPARRKVWSLARHLKQQGYRTVCVHPFSLSFFNRIKVMPNIGFDELQGEDNFSRAERFGPFVSDAALGCRIQELVNTSRQPLFLFAISMEAHGPWAADRFADFEEEPEPPAMPVWGDRQLSMYLTHVKNTDAMLGSLCCGLQKNQAPTVLGFYGDHVGNISHLFKKADYHDTATDYLLWRSDMDLGGQQETLSAARFGGKCLQVMHLSQDPAHSRRK